MTGKNIAIIIPTFNESENIPLLLEKINKVLPQAKIVIIDDSPEKEFKKLKEKVEDKNIELISRTGKLGRGTAVIDGFKLALKDKNIERLFEMDADLSHDPSDFPKFLKKMDDVDADLVVGTRYDGEGKISNWPKNRLIKSKAANLYLKSVLGLDLTDFTSGFRLYSRRAAQFLIKVDFKTSGFILHSESAYNLKKNEFIITEAPIHFRNRKYGESSLGSEKISESFVGILRVRLGK